MNAQQLDILKNANKNPYHWHNMPIEKEKKIVISELINMGKLYINEHLTAYSISDIGITTVTKQRIENSVTSITGSSEISS